MAQVQECIKSAKSTIDVAYAILTTDMTIKNNLSLVLLALLLFYCFLGH
jgi:hypothetical protein